MAKEKRAIGTFDIETDPFKAGRRERPFLCGFYDGRVYRQWGGPNCVRDCWEQGMKKFRGIIYAHAGGKFDFKFLLPHLPKKLIEVFCIRSRIASITVGEVEFRDSYLMIPVPLKAYGKKEIEIWKLEKEHRQKYMAEIGEYLRVDCYSLHAMVSEFVAEYGMGLTLAGRAFAALRERFGIKPPHANPFFDENYRRFYFGGRVQFWELGQLKGAFKTYDINSAYPWAMRFPHVFAPEFDTRSRLPRKEMDLAVGFVEFTGEATDLPWRGDDGSLNFTHRRGSFCVTGWELLAALKCDRVKIDTVDCFHAPVEVLDFSPFVDHFYSLKKNATTPGERLFAKLFLNGAYGRFALDVKSFRDVRTVPYGENPNTKDDCGWELAADLDAIGLSIWERPTPVHRNSYFNVATAASITGFVRAYLLEQMARCKRVVYCDTDSILCEDGRGLEIGPELGQWKEEGETVRGGAYIAGKKLYALKMRDGKWKCAAKGVDLAPEQIVRVAKGESMTSTFDAPTFSLFSGEKWITRTIRRADMRGKATP